MGIGKFVKALGKAIEAENQQSKTSGSKASGTLGFQETGTPPKTDSKGRVILILKSSSTGVKYPVNLAQIDQEVANSLAGKPNEDEEFTKSAKLFMRPDVESQYANSVVLETEAGKRVGWIKKEASDDATSVIGQISSIISKTVPELSGREFTFQVTAHIEGNWNEVGEDDKEVWEADIDFMEIRIKNPVEIEID